MIVMRKERETRWRNNRKVDFWHKWSEEGGVLVGKSSALPGAIEPRCLLFQKKV